MSLYRFIASNHPLVEVDYSGFIEMKVRDIKMLEPIPEPPVTYQSWDEVDPDATILYAKDEADLGGLCIALCDNPPYGLERYIEKSHIYWLEGDFHSKFLNQLTKYVKANVRKEDFVELWSIWFGENKESKHVKKVYQNQISPADFEILRHHECCCLLIV
ncbi:hypothetical protein ACFVSW_04890 [Neobacillus sp. NPDC058068]|uniref:hypothetical protein n=1 Tax=Neobacillus sp. NPDC058068 TaxID=3346325 RepID=UPI0036DD9168